MTPYDVITGRPSVLRFVECSTGNRGLDWRERMSPNIRSNHQIRKFPFIVIDYLSLGIGVRRSRIRSWWLERSQYSWWRYRDYLIRKKHIRIMKSLLFLDLSLVSRPYEISTEFFCSDISPKLTLNDTVVLIHRSGDEKVTYREKS